MAYISNEIINEIRNKTDIVDVVSRYVNLTKKGKNYIGVCPFHDDHSPSMSVSPEKQIFTCFSCGATGNVLVLVIILILVIVKEMNTLIYMIVLINFIKIVYLLIWVRMLFSI